MRRVIPRPDPDAVGAILRAAAETAVLPRFRALKDHEVMEKGAGDIVTAADLEAERYLTAELTALLPGSTTVGEEAHHADPAILARFSGDAPVWVIDPVDGTRNFSKGRETFCTLVALLAGGETRMAWLYDPARDRLAVAERGAGAFLDSVRLSVPPPPPAAEMIGQANLSYFDRAARETVRARLQRSFARLDPLYCAGHDFLQQARGLRHFSFYRRIWPWDHAAGTLILQEAGGTVGRLDRGAYDPGARVGGLLSAADAPSWEAVRDVLLAPAGPGD